MIRFGRRNYFAARRHRLPLRWVFLVMAAGLVALVAWAGRMLFR